MTEVDIECKEVESSACKDMKETQVMSFANKEETKESSVDGPELKKEKETTNKDDNKKSEEEKPVEVKEDKCEIETVETITRRLREKAAREAAEAKMAKAQQQQYHPQPIKISSPISFSSAGNSDSISESVEIGADSFEAEEKRKLQSRGRFIGINRMNDKKVKNFRKVESVDPPVPKPDVSSIVFNLSNNLKVLGSSDNAFVPGFDPTNQGNISWNDLKLDISSKSLGVQKRNTPNSLKSGTIEKEWRKGASDAANAEISGDDLSENRVGDPEDGEICSTAEEEADQTVESETTWPENSTNAYFEPQGQGEDAAYWTEDGYAMYGAGDWYPMYSELEEIRRQMKQLQKIPEQMKKVQREVQEIDKNVKAILKNVTKDPEEEPGRVQEVNPARHTDRLVSVPAGTKVLVLTDSICSRMNGYKINSELKVCVRSYGGLTVTEMITIVSTLDEDVCYDVDYVFFHVGTNDLGAEDFPSLKSEIKILIKRSLKIFSNATIFMSAILPRYGSTRELKDRQELNLLIANLSEKYNRVQFIDASCHFVEREIDNTLRGDLYKRDYIHLTLKGMGVLATAFRQVLDMYIQQNEGNAKTNYNINNISISSIGSAGEPADCSGYNQSVGSQVSFSPSQSASYQSGYGDRSMQGSSATFTSSAASAIASHVTPAVPAVALTNVGGNMMNPRQRISGRYTQYRR